METVTYILPAYWASYLINNDPSGLEDGEQEQIDRWIKAHGNISFCCTEGEPYFKPYNDASKLGEDVLEYTALID